MVEQTTTTTSVNPTIGDKIKSAVGMGTTVRTTQTSTATTGVQQMAQPVLVQQPVLAQTTARIIEEAPIIKTGTSTSVIADVRRKENVLIEERPIIQQNITKPVIEVHEKHIERSIGEAPIFKQQTAATVVQEIGRENLGFQAPLPNVVTQNIQEAATVTNLKAAPVVAEIHNRPVIERHEQVFIHENRQQPITEVITQPIVQNIYEKPVIVKSTERIVETGAPMLATTGMTSTTTFTGMQTGMASTLPTTAIQNAVPTRLGATAMSGSTMTTGLTSGVLPTTGLGASTMTTEHVGIASKVKNALHLGHHGHTATTGTTGVDYDFDPDKKVVSAPLGSQGVTGATIIPGKRL